MSSVTSSSVFLCFHLVADLNIAQKSMSGLLSVLATAKLWFALVVFISCLYSRSLHVMYVALGAVFAAIVGKVLKRVWRQPRPHGQAGYGMPSTHSQGIMFFAAYSHCAMPSHDWVVLVLSLFALALAWSRVQLGYHTFQQVLVGSLIGVSLAILWHSQWQGLHHTLLTFLDAQLPAIRAIVS
ncbi:phosphatidic acid phosphatase type 2/haloperoxidase [Gongronella butleri]|nr:phosphatidic acid phosphatase type 2/haloperoxidase [Gongronella butleri]